MVSPNDVGTDKCNWVSYFALDQVIYEMQFDALLEVIPENLSGVRRSTVATDLFQPSPSVKLGLSRKKKDTRKVPELFSTVCSSDANPGAKPFY